MPNSRPATARTAHHLAALLVSVFWMASAVAAPDASAVGAVHEGTGFSGGADPVIRLLSDKGLTPPVAANAAVDAAAPPPVAETRFVERMRDKASDMVLTAMNFLGVPYRRGGNTADHGFDCSGFTRHIFELSLGLVLPRRADEQATTAGLLRISREELKPGDLVFFNTMRRTFSHVGIYVGAGKFVHSPKPGGEVRIDDMHAAYWERRFTGGRRAEPAASPTSEPVAPDVAHLN